MLNTGHTYSCLPFTGDTLTYLLPPFLALTSYLLSPTSFSTSYLPFYLLPPTSLSTSYLPPISYLPYHLLPPFLPHIFLLTSFLLPLSTSHLLKNLRYHWFASSSPFTRWVGRRRQELTPSPSNRISLTFLMYCHA